MARTYRPPPPSKILKKMIAMNASKDLTIVAGNGKEVKCHRIIFEVHSDVLAAMLSPANGFIESQTGRIKMMENSEEGLSYLIQYLYGMHIFLEDEKFSSDIAVELLKTGTMYELTELRDGLVQMLLGKEKDYFAPDDLLELHFFLKNVGGEGDLGLLERYSLEVMKSLSHAIWTCDEFKKLEISAPDAAKKLRMALADEDKDTTTAGEIIKRHHYRQYIFVESPKLLQNLFLRESSKDMTLVAMDGSQAKVHRVIFEAHGDDLAALPYPVGAQKGKIHISGKGLFILIKYLYETEDLSSKDHDFSSDMVVELFKTAEEHDLSGFKDRLVDFIQQQETEWFHPNDLVDLYVYLYYKNLEEEEKEEEEKKEDDEEEEDEEDEEEEYVQQGRLDKRALEKLKNSWLYDSLELSKDIKTCERFVELRGTDPTLACSLIWELLEFSESEAEMKLAQANSRRGRYYY